MGDDRLLRTTDREDDVIRRVATRLRIPVSSDPAFDARVMQAVRAEQREGAFPTRRLIARWSGWLWGGGALLAATALLVLVYRRDRAGSDMTMTAPSPRTVVAAPVRGAAAVPAAPATHPAPQVVRFVFVIPAGARVQRVTVAGSFNGWDTSVTPLRPDGRGRWVTDLPLRPGRYVYQFVINGNEWVPDPTAPRDAGADFGSRNSVVMVTTGA